MSCVSSTDNPEAGSSNSSNFGSDAKHDQVPRPFARHMADPDPLVTVVLEVEKVDHLFHSLAVAQFLAVGFGREQDVRQQAGLPMPVPPDQQVLQNSGLLKQLNILKSARNTKAGNLICVDVQQFVSVQSECCPPLDDKSVRSG